MFESLVCHLESKSGSCNNSTYFGVGGEGQRTGGDVYRTVHKQILSRASFLGSSPSSTPISRMIFARLLLNLARTAKAEHSNGLFLNSRNTLCKSSQYRVDIQK